MTKSNKKDAEVLAAEKAEEEAMTAWKTAKLVAEQACAEADQAKKTYYAACQSSRKARIKSDASAPKCKMVVVNSWRSKEENNWQVVVIRKMTPGGTLVVRSVGCSDDEEEYRFRFDNNSGIWKQLKSSRYNCRISVTRELRDVPAEYLPQSNNWIIDES